MAIEINRLDPKLVSDQDSMTFWQKEEKKPPKSQFQTFEGAET